MKLLNEHILLVVCFIVLWDPQLLLASMKQRSSSSEARLDSIMVTLDRIYDSAPNDLIKMFGLPLSAETTTVKNRHTDEQDFIYKYRFHEATVAIYHATGMKRYLLGDLDLTNFEHLSHVGITASMSLRSLRRLVGKEDTVTQLTSGDLQLTYETGEELVTEISFIFRGNKLRSIHYQPYLD